MTTTDDPGASPVEGPATPGQEVEDPGPTLDSAEAVAAPVVVVETVASAVSAGSSGPTEATDVAAHTGAAGPVEGAGGADDTGAAGRVEEAGDADDTIAAGPVGEAAGTDDAGAAGPAGHGRIARVWHLLAVVALVALATSPILVGAASLVGETWVPLSDWASMVVRVDQVGTADTPLVGPYSFHGFAHPGPLLYWLAAPAFHAGGADPRTLLWVGAAVNVVAVAALLGLARRRGGWPLLLATTVLAALVVRGIGARALVDLWNPYVALLPFLMAIALAVDAALGHRRSLVWAVVPASFAVQCHVAFASLAGVAALWLALSLVLRARSERAGTGEERPPPWRPTLVRAALVGALLWAGPLLDVLVGQQNPVRVARGLAADGGRVGLVEAAQLVGAYARPDGHWWRGDEFPASVTGGPADTLGVALLAALLVAVATAGRRRGLRDVVALATLALALLVAAVPAASRLYTPTSAYLAEWVKVVAGLGWFATAWGAGRVLGARRTTPSDGRRLPLRAPHPSPGDGNGARSGPAAVAPTVAAAGVAVAVVALAAASTWAGAARMELPPHDHAGKVAELERAARARLDPDLTYRVELSGSHHVHYAALVPALADAGLTVVTDDGAAGQKWGRDLLWEPGDEVDATLTLTADRATDPERDAAACDADPEARLVWSSAGLTAEDRAWLDDLKWRTLGDEVVTDADRDRWQVLTARSDRIRLYEAPEPCDVR